MRFDRFPTSLLLAAALTSCGVGSDAQSWINEQKTESALIVLASVPEVVDTLPATYVAKVYDPFDPARISARSSTAENAGKSEVIFPDVPISSLWIVGFITGSASEKSAVIRSGNYYRTVKNGNRIGEERALVTEVSWNGVLLNYDGKDSQWLLRQK